ncbi:unnamed protein product [Candidula unifasciata]|uniref:Anaphase-promoting complex subunit 4-like WD40 domain-containing protein n=1 Tax=Candidula unifasciata TaxID=100452 RepID=A0A8S3ZUW3_9EUPU|nr:unnamed protein product [Candidula unifasciata]
MWFLRKMATTYADEIKKFFATNAKTRDVQAHTAKVHSVAWSCDGRRLASGSDRLTKDYTVFRGHGASVDQLCWNPHNPGQLATASGDKTFKFEVNEISFNKDYFAIGSADALVSLWNLPELVCMRTFTRLEWPVRTLSFSNDGKMLASASEDLVIDIGEVETGEKLHQITCDSPTFTVAWHPKRNLLAYACDDRRDRDAGIVRVFGFPSDT